MNQPISKRRFYLCTALFSVCLLLPPFAGAAPQVYADPTTTCAGLTPCFATVQEAVDNAGPAPAQVGVFPGIYAESVTLSTMGAAIAGGQGDITVQALDAAGQPATTGVLIDPNAMGGPGTGAGLESGTMGPFSGDITLRGLEVTSPDSAAIGVSAIGNLVAEDLVVDQAAAFGFVGQATGNANLARIQANANGTSGLVLLVDGNLEATDLVATQNMGDGVAMMVSGNTLLDGVEASDNDTGMQLLACTQADVRNVLTERNLDIGTLVIYGPDDCTMPTTIDASGLSLKLDARFPHSDTVAPSNLKGVSGVLTAENIQSFENGNVGIAMTSTTGSAQVDGLFANDNLGPGIVLQGVFITVDDGEAIGNRSGMFVLADEADLTRVITNQNLAMPADPPTGGAGTVISARLAFINDLQADDNQSAGLLLTGPQNGGAATIDMVDSQFDANLHGVQIDAITPVSVQFDNLFVTNNVITGLQLPGLDTGVFRNLEISGSLVGAEVEVATALLMETSQFQSNTTGASVALQPGAQGSVGCSNFLGNAIAGLELAQGVQLTARSNYWGDPSGPDHPGNPGGMGDAVFDGANGGAGAVDYSGFLAQPATANDCPQGLPRPQPIPVMNGFGQVFLLLGILGVALVVAPVRGIRSFSGF